MFLKAVHVCEDVRIEENGTFTLVGVHSERIFVPVDQGEIRVPRLLVVAMVGGLAGADRLRFRQWLRAADDASIEPPAMAEQAHDAAADEHNFVFGDAPMVFPGIGVYEVALDVEAAGTSAAYRYRFRLERAPAVRSAP
ncbi:MAG: hypothetical protein H0T89_17790 [Deltaproteobacteria bacterium]|nr:hypothetical protein [Deltaproteobacteria bacterium]MDQ3301504.1 hypothetical protein [Myxococcota bacterium]